MTRTVPFFVTASPSAVELAVSSLGSVGITVTPTSDVAAESMAGRLEYVTVPDRRPVPPLSPVEVAPLARPVPAQELRVLNLVAQGMSNKEIAAVLGVGPATVKSHVCHVVRRLGAVDRVNAVLIGCRLGIIDNRPVAEQVVA